VNHAWRALVKWLLVVGMVIPSNGARALAGTGNIHRQASFGRAAIPNELE
jgi:hypothetical protein